MKLFKKHLLFSLSLITSFSIVSCGPNIRNVCKNVPFLSSCVNGGPIYFVELQKRSIDSQIYVIQGNDDCSTFMQNAVNFNSWDYETFGKSRKYTDDMPEILYETATILFLWDVDSEPVTGHIRVAEDGVVYVCQRKTYVCSKPGLGDYNFCMTYSTK